MSRGGTFQEQDRIRLAILELYAQGLARALRRAGLLTTADVDAVLERADDITEQKRRSWGTSEVYWLCRCECGHEHAMGAYSLRSGRSKGCVACRRAARQKAAS